MKEREYSSLLNERASKQLRLIKNKSGIELYILLTTWKNYAGKVEIECDHPNNSFFFDKHMYKLSGYSEIHTTVVNKDSRIWEGVAKIKTLTNQMEQIIQEKIEEKGAINKKDKGSMCEWIHLLEENRKWRWKYLKEKEIHELIYYILKIQEAKEGVKLKTIATLLNHMTRYPEEIGGKYVEDIVKTIINIWKKLPGGWDAIDQYPNITNMQSILLQWGDRVIQHRTKLSQTTRGLIKDMYKWYIPKHIKYMTRAYLNDILEFANYCCLKKCNVEYQNFIETLAWAHLKMEKDTTPLNQKAFIPLALNILRMPGRIIANYPNVLIACVKDKDLINILLQYLNLNFFTEIIQQQGIQPSVKINLLKVSDKIKVHPLQQLKWLETIVVETHIMSTPQILRVSKLLSRYQYSMNTSIKMIKLWQVTLAAYIKKGETKQMKLWNRFFKWLNKFVKVLTLNDQNQKMELFTRIVKILNDLFEGLQDKVMEFTNKHFLNVTDPVTRLIMKKWMGPRLYKQIQDGIDKNDVQKQAYHLLCQWDSGKAPPIEPWQNYKQLTQLRKGAPNHFYNTIKKWFYKLSNVKKQEVITMHGMYTVNEKIQLFAILHSRENVGITMLQSTFTIFHQIEESQRFKLYQILFERYWNLPLSNGVEMWIQSEPSLQVYMYCSLFYIAARETPPEWHFNSSTINVYMIQCMAELIHQALVLLPSKQIHVWIHFWHRFYDKYQKYIEDNLPQVLTPEFITCLTLNQYTRTSMQPLILENQIWKKMLTVQQDSRFLGSFVQYIANSSHFSEVLYWFCIHSHVLERLFKTLKNNQHVLLASAWVCLILENTTIEDLKNNDRLKYNMSACISHLYQHIVYMMELKQDINPILYIAVRICMYTPHQGLHMLLMPLANRLMKSWDNIHDETQQKLAGILLHYFSFVKYHPSLEGPLAGIFQCSFDEIGEASKAYLKSICLKGLLQCPENWDEHNTPWYWIDDYGTVETPYSRLMSTKLLDFPPMYIQSTGYCSKFPYFYIGALVEVKDERFLRRFGVIYNKICPGIIVALSKDNMDIRLLERPQLKYPSFNNTPLCANNYVNIKNTNWGSHVFPAGHVAQMDMSARLITNMGDLPWNWDKFVKMNPLFMIHDQISRRQKGKNKFQ